MDHIECRALWTTDGLVAAWCRITGPPCSLPCEVVLIGIVQWPSAYEGAWSVSRGECLTTPQASARKRPFF